MRLWWLGSGRARCRHRRRRGHPEGGYRWPLAASTLPPSCKVGLSETEPDEGRFLCLGQAVVRQNGCAAPSMRERKVLGALEARVIDPSALREAARHGRGGVVRGGGGKDPTQGRGALNTRTRVVSARGPCLRSDGAFWKCARGTRLQLFPPDCRGTAVDFGPDCSLWSS